MRRILTLCVAAAVVLAPLLPSVALPSVALGARLHKITTLPATTPPGTTSPFSPGVPQAPITVPTQTAPPVATAPATGTSTSGSGLSGGSAVAIAIGALIVLGGISYFIWRDSRRHVRMRPSGADAAGTVTGGSRGSKAPPKPRKLSPAERRRRKRGRARR